MGWCVLLGPVVAILVVALGWVSRSEGPSISEVGPREPVGWDTAVAPLSAEDEALFDRAVAATELSAEAIRTAVVSAQDSGMNVVALPAGDTTIDETIEVPENITIIGSEEPGTPTRINVRRDRGALFQCTGDNVRFSRIYLEGPDRAAHSQHKTTGISNNRHFNVAVDHVEMAGFCTAAGFGGGSGSVRTSYIHNNAREGLGYGTIVGGGAHVQIVDNEYSNNRHSVASNGTLRRIPEARPHKLIVHAPNPYLTYFEIAHCNIHDDEESWPYCAVDAHSGMDGSFNVHHNLFAHLTKGIDFSSGTGTINKNYFKDCYEPVTLGWRRGQHNDWHVEDAITHDVELFNNAFERCLFTYGFFAGWAVNIYVNGELYPGTEGEAKWPTLHLNKNSVDFGDLGDAQCDSSLWVSNAQTLGNNKLNWAVQEDIPWLEITPSSGTVDAVSQQALTLSISPQALPARGRQSAIFRVYSIDRPGNYEEIRVSASCSE